MTESLTNIDQISQRGEEIYQKIKNALEKNNLGQFVAIHVGSGNYYIGKTPEEASKKARDAHPGSVSYLTRIGPDRGVFTVRSFKRDSDNWLFRSFGLADR